MLPRALLSSSVAVGVAGGVGGGVGGGVAGGVGGGGDLAEIVPRYLGPRDEPWLRALLELYAAFEGKRRSALRERLAEPLVVRAPRAPLRLARHVLDRVTKAKLGSPVSPELARSVVFARACEEPDRERALAAAAGVLELEPEVLEELLFADLRSSERVGRLPPELSPVALAQNANLALAAALLGRAQSLTLRAFGDTRPLVRHAQLAGLICTARRLDSGVELEISGPFALFRHTLIYGKRLASLVPRAMGCERFEIAARVALGPGPGLVTYRLRSGDPLPAGRELARHDNQVEARFARDFARLGSDWQLVREPEPVPLGDGRLLFPDFALVHRSSGRRVLLELVGFWTARYLLDKLDRLREARLGSLFVCVDERRACRDEAMPEGAEVIRFRGKLDAAHVLARIEERGSQRGERLEPL